MTESNRILCLNHGFVELVDHMGDDQRILRGARVSYAANAKAHTPDEDRNLIRYMMRHRHTSPFEKVVFEFHCKMPIFVARQWIRHRTASTNEISGRYSQLPNEFYVPEAEQVRAQSLFNKQGRDGEVDAETLDNFLEYIWVSQPVAYRRYEEDLKKGVARELARINLPLSIYTEWYWTINLHNLLHFIGLRSDSHAQYEIRVFSDAMYELIKPIVPWSVEAFEDYHPMRGAHTFSRMEMGVIKKLMNEMNDEAGNRWLSVDRLVSDYGLSKREALEFRSEIGLTE